MDQSKIPEHTPVIGADGMPTGTVDRIEAPRLKIRRARALFPSNYPLADWAMRWIAGVQP